MMTINSLFHPNYFLVDIVVSNDKTTLTGINNNEQKQSTSCKNEQTPVFKLIYF